MLLSKGPCSGWWPLAGGRFHDVPRACLTRGPCPPEPAGLPDTWLGGQQRRAMVSGSSCHDLFHPAALPRVVAGARDTPLPSPPAAFPPLGGCCHSSESRHLTYQAGFLPEAPHSLCFRWHLLSSARGSRFLAPVCLLLGCSDALGPCGARGRWPGTAGALWGRWEGIWRVCGVAVMSSG